jgi:predicted DNA-binding protein
MSKKEIPRKMVTTYLPIEVHRQVKESAEQLGQPVSVWLERAAEARIEAVKDLRP